VEEKGVNLGNLEHQTLSDDVLLIKLGQKLDNNNAQDMVVAITSALESGYRFLIVDMTALEFLSSAGVGSFLGTVEAARSAGGDIVLCNVSENIMHVLTVLDVAEYLTVKPTRQDAETMCGVMA